MTRINWEIEAGETINVLMALSHYANYLTETLDFEKEPEESKELAEHALRVNATRLSLKRQTEDQI
jgi:hypothetical protein